MNKHMRKWDTQEAFNQWLNQPNNQHLTGDSKAYTAFLAFSKLEGDPRTVQRFSAWLEEYNPGDQAYPQDRRRLIQGYNASPADSAGAVRQKHDLTALYQQWLDESNFDDSPDKFKAFLQNHFPQLVKELKY